MKALARLIRWFLFAAFFLLAFWFALKNATPVPLVLTSDVRWEQVPLIFIILLSLCAGALLGALAAAPSIFRLRRELSRATHAAGRHGVPEPAAERATHAARSAGAVGQDS